MWKSTLWIGRGTDDAAYASNGVRTSFVRTDQDQFACQNDITLPLGKALFAAESLKQRLAASQALSQTERTINSLLAGWSAAANAHRWQVNMRHDNISQTGAKKTGTAAYGYQITDAFQANASLGTAYKAPLMNDLYFPDTLFVGNGNPNLKPELARNREASLHYETTRDHASATYFNNQITNLIQWSEAPIAGSYFYVPQNLAAAKISGWTLAYKGTYGPLMLRSSVHLQNPRDTETGLLLTQRARQRATVGADYTTGAWTLGGEMTASGERYSDSANLQHLGGYALTNLNVLYCLDRDLSLFARINNLFDKKYELVTDYGVPGLNALVGIRYQPK